VPALLILVVVLALTGCAAALKRDSRCLSTLTVDVIQAHEELASLEAAWRASLARRDLAMTRSRSLQPEGGDSMAEQTAWRDTQESYARLQDAKTRHQPLMTMYEKLYQRVRTRTEEEEILSEVRTFMLAGPASFMFYPIVRWNVRAVLWDNSDPDAPTDPVTTFCSLRMNEEPPSSHPDGIQALAS
jgi:hypothetical protein